MPGESALRSGHSGDFSVRKGIDVLIRAFRDEFAPDEPVRLLMKSTSPAPEYAVGDSRITLTSGFLDQEALLDLLRQMDVFVLPSRGEGFGLCGLEAMATGLPLIATAWGGPSEYLDPEYSYSLQYHLVEAGGVESNHVRYHGLWAEPDYEHLRHLLRWLFAHPDMAAERGKVAAERVRERWTWDRVARQICRDLDHSRPDIKGKLAVRIAQISTLCTPVRRDRCGSVESLVWLLSRELIRLGHEVTVFATADSEPPGELVGTLPGPYGQAGSPGDWQLCEWINLCRAVEQSARFDVLHSHGYLLGLPLQGLSRSPLIHTYHVQPAMDQANAWRLAGSPWVTALSHFQWSAFPALQPAAVIHHGVDPEQFTLNAIPDDYVCYLGRFMPEKGPLAAIEAARAMGVRLLLAGPPNPYFHQHIEPLIDGRSVEYVGYVTGTERNHLLGHARAFAPPSCRNRNRSDWSVPEALMCGTQVVTTPLGAVAEAASIKGSQATSRGHSEEFVQQILQELFVGPMPDSKGCPSRGSPARRMAQQYSQLFENVLPCSAPASQPICE